ncbi:MAG: FxsA family protein, partial [Acidimicrobiia bacterium]|nr:FxsA family protein [Acidimicrobiia bacterium]
MFFVLVLLFLGLPLAELYVLLQVAQGIGVLETIAVLVAVSVVGGWLVRREGVG